MKCPLRPTSECVRCDRDCEYLPKKKESRRTGRFYVALTRKGSPVVRTDDGTPRLFLTKRAARRALPDREYAKIIIRIGVE